MRDGCAHDCGDDDDPEDDYDIYLNWRNTGIFDGEPLTGPWPWSLRACDEAPADVGEIDYVELRIH